MRYHNPALHKQSLGRCRAHEWEFIVIFAPIVNNKIVQRCKHCLESSYLTNDMYKKLTELSSTTNL